MRFLTENGTLYEIKDGHWYRLSATERSGKTRKDSGRIVGTPIVEPGRPAIIQDEDVLPGHSGHCITTSNVVVIQT